MCMITITIAKCYYKNDHFGCGKLVSGIPLAPCSSQMLYKQY
jgi:hypothetical protein